MNNDIMTKLIHHMWKPSDILNGQKNVKDVKACTRCKWIKYWDFSWGRTIFLNTVNGKFEHYKTPSCVLPNTLL